MECKNVHFWDILLFYFRKGKKAAGAHKEICEVYGVNCLSERTCQNLFYKFCPGDFSPKDDQRSGRPSEVDDIMTATIESNHHITVREIAKQLNISHITIENHIRHLGLWWRFRKPILFDGSPFYLCKLAGSISIQKNNAFSPSQCIYNNEPRTLSNV